MLLLSDLAAHPVVVLVAILLYRLMTHIERRKLIKRARSADLPAIARAIEGPRLPFGRRPGSEQGTALLE